MPYARKIAIGDILLRVAFLLLMASRLIVEWVGGALGEVDDVHVILHFLQSLRLKTRGGQNFVICPTPRFGDGDVPTQSVAC